MNHDTIAAIATGMTNSGIGVIRISGPKALEVAQRVFFCKKKDRLVPKQLVNAGTHTIHYGFVCDGDCIIDEVLLLLMRAPRSYTAEDTVELDCHGGSFVMKRILETVIRQGARLAEPGEFTKRAFLNGRIDLSQAEAVMDLIEAKNEGSREASLHQLRGELKDTVDQLRQTILHEVAFIESALDDPEHISLEGYTQKLYFIVDNVGNSVDNLIKTADFGELLKNGIRTAIVGKPNAGKSSLMNQLLGRERSIVTDIPGTTRDTVEEQINLSGVLLNVIDTAGIHTSSDVVEKIGIDKAADCIREADLVLYVMDSSEQFDESDETILHLIEGKKVIFLYNKSDLTPVTEIDEMKEILSKRGVGKGQELRLIPVSAKNGTGLDELAEAVREMFFAGEISEQDERILCNIRQKEALCKAQESLTLVKNAIADGMPEDLYPIDLMDAYEALGRITGESVGEDLINEIFSKFCMGK